MSITALTETTFWNNTLLEYFHAVIIFLSFLILGKLVGYLAMKQGRKLVEKTKTQLDDYIVNFLSSFSSLIGIFAGLFFVKEMLILPDLVDRIFVVAFTVVIILFGAVILQKISLLILRGRFARILKKNNLGETILPFFEKLTVVVIWILAGLLFLSNVGFNISSLLAGLGLGGLAFALAAQDTLGNLFASLAIFADQPFKVGDMVRIGDVEGTVKEVGVRNTRIQSFQGKTQYVIPNSKVADSIIENVSKRDCKRFDFVIGLTYDTSAKQMKKAIQIVRDILEKHPDVQEDYWVNFFEFGDFSLNIRVKVLLSLGPEGTYSYVLKAREEVNFQILERFEKAGLKFAFPTQTIELKKS